MRYRAPYGANNEDDDDGGVDDAGRGHGREKGELRSLVHAVVGENLGDGIEVAAIPTLATLSLYFLKHILERRKKNTYIFI